MLDTDGLNVRTVENAPDGEWNGKYLVYQVNPAMKATAAALAKKLDVTVIDEMPDVLAAKEKKPDFYIVLGVF